MPPLKSLRGGITYFCKEVQKTLLGYKSGGSEFIPVYQIYTPLELFW